ncbi:hypothetical protein GTA08_BOTSDO10161 [Neofusicoccum parvum]|uniref:Uncharacterized protein n=1 Tax=Neofusicoccum parvum TaxID=310453 RepID=A0ACB5S0Y3_9PEZI|nr:hypothetical protein GTA08_BOTSDO10161 [Neofusicoccum parvum]
MRASLPHAFALLPALAAAAVLPPALHRAHARAQSLDDVRPLVLELDAQNAQATFSVPCQGCLGADDDESLVFDFQVFPADQPCGESNVTLNGHPLIQEWNGIRAAGNGSISSSNKATDEHDPEHDLELSWETACLFDSVLESTESEYGNDVAQLLTVNIRKVDDRSIHDAAGFSVSFKQAARKVELLRLAINPTSLPDAGEGEDWRDPPAELRLVSVDFDDLPEGFFHQSSSIEDEIELLRKLEADEKEIQERIRHQKKIIHAHMRDHAHSLRDELQTCDNLSCVFRAFLHKAHGAASAHRRRPDHPGLHLADRTDKVLLRHLLLPLMDKVLPHHHHLLPLVDLLLPRRLTTTAMDLMDLMDLDLMGLGLMDLVLSMPFS